MYADISILLHTRKFSSSCNPKFMRIKLFLARNKLPLQTSTCTFRENSSEAYFLPILAHFFLIESTIFPTGRHRGATSPRACVVRVRDVLSTEIPGRLALLENRSAAVRDVSSFLASEWNYVSSRRLFVIFFLLQLWEKICFFRSSINQICFLHSNIVIG